MSVDTVKRIADLLRAARVDGAVDDPVYFEQKASTWDAVAADEPSRAAEARGFADAARARARELRGVKSSHDPTGTRCACLDVKYRCEGCGNDVAVNEALMHNALRALLDIKRVVEARVKSDDGEVNEALYAASLITLVERGLTTDLRELGSFIVVAAGDLQPGEDRVVKVPK
jgi:hypothetical protein